MAGYSTRRTTQILASLAVALLVISLFALNAGPIETDLGETVAALYRYLFSPAPHESQLPQIVGQLRLPRLLLGILVGGGLAIAGAVMQALFRNPMADPGLLGVSSGAALGAVASIVLGASLLPGLYAQFGRWILVLAAFTVSMGCLFLVYHLARREGRTDIPTMLLAGVAVNAIAGALIGLLSYVASDTELRDLVFWSLGSLEVSDWWKLLVTAVIVLPSGIYILHYSLALNAMLLGESEARHLGFNIERIKRVLIVLVALMVAVLVSMSGIIGFVGLVVPHVLRLVFGPDHRLLLPGSALFGAILLVVADVVARTAVAPAEIPIGIITAVIGGPFFLALLVHHRRRQRL